MPHLTNALLAVSCLGLGLSIFMAVRAFLENRREQAAPFRHYFESRHDRSLLPQGTTSDDGDFYDGHSRFEAVNVRDPSAARYSRGSGAIRQDRDKH